jgi:hypothetical protein
MWNHSETQLFWIITGMVRLDGVMVASMLMAQSVYHYVGLSRMVVNFQLIILD